MDIKQKILSLVKVDKNSECWVWQGKKDKKRGYGKTSEGLLAHRVCFTAFAGQIPDGLVLDHLCRNTSCVNPEHLEAVTQGENVRRGLAGENSRRKTECPKGHPLSGDNLVPYKLKIGKRQCLICTNEHRRANRAAKRQGNLA